MTTQKCYCGAPKEFSQCCEAYITGVSKAGTAELLMRSRYSAYVTQSADYLVATTHSSQRKFHSKEEIQEWASGNQWQKLEVLNSTENTVEFKAYFIDPLGNNQIHHEFSNFILENGSWLYVNGTFLSL
jgi:SEC-C motif-containing protein